VDDQPPVAQFVAESLDEHRPVVGQPAGRHPLLGEVGEQVVGAPFVEAGVVRPSARRLLVGAGQFAKEGTQCAAQLSRPSGGIALPERHPADFAGRGGHQHPVVGDVLDAPRGRAEQKHVADSRLVHHLLVQLTDPPPGALCAGEEHAEQSAVGNRPSAGNREPLGAAPRGQLAADAVPDETRTELGERIGRVAAGEHVQHRFERGARQTGERRGAADEGFDVVDAKWFHRDHRDDVLGEHVERIARIAHRLDQSVAHALGNHCTLHEVAAELREDHTLGHRAHLVTGAPYALQTGGD
jgi:hypothetical protein